MYTLKIDNFGKIESGEVCVGDFTVFAGPNNTGKSFVSKLLYSVFNALNANLTHERLRRKCMSFQRLVGRLTYEQRLYERHPGRPQIRDTARIRELAQRVEMIVSSYARNDDSLEDVVAQLLHTLDEARVWGERVVIRLEHDLESRARRRLISDVRTELLTSIDRLKVELERITDPYSFALAELEYRTTQNLIRNFQVSEIEMLRGVSDEETCINLDDAFSFTTAENGIKLLLDETPLGVIGSAPNFIYLESPIYWKLFRALEFVGSPRTGPRYRSRDTLTGVPGYFYDLADSLTFEYSGEVAYPSVCEFLTGSDVLNGRVAVSDRGEMAFEEAGRSYPLHTAATGVANLGILAALIERRVIDHGTMLFIDEPEAHLHPGWQVVIAEALFELAKGGVKVVIATHSVDILKWLEVRVKKNPDDARFVALNRFPNPAQCNDPLDIRIEQIKQDLTKPFLDLFLELP